MKHITFTVDCACGWTAGPFLTCAEANKAVKEHHLHNIHKDYEEVELW